MEFRLAEKKDLKAIMKIINAAKDFLKSEGIDQWQQGYPDCKVMRKDILNHNCYILAEKDKIFAHAAVTFSEEKSYNKIYQGKWLSNANYAVVHRLAVDNEYKGKELAKLLLDKIEELVFKNGINSIKIDTHQDNISMQRLLKKSNFKYCGIIYLEDGSKRLAYENHLEGDNLWKN
ncbi:GNAT family N-acetyltransferase [Halanaerobium hydrogeniformans]|uniref:GCN5-related N-acetyltransferase n=1 Tax=Halanaerobium hydrogeniformans TaxID=656519 RepID=E4RK47_HALHG|nr:GNAT family N-acetyltransferase [Halanaerobium hydrogeniformans]ADQ14599.1 GCN5-related N-acetyltransferase [Halanaerobium hydrogeniformans]